MQVAHKQTWDNHYSLVTIKSFLIWTFTLTVCFLVVGFPVVVLMATVAALLAVVLQSVLSISAVLLVVGSIMGINVLGIVVGAAILTAKGIHPQDVKWLRWLHGEGEPSHAPIYASCPLTCNLTH